MIEFDLADPAELSDLMDSKAYQKHCEKRSH